MKKRFLPFSLLLVVMILGLPTMIADNGGHYVPRTNETPSADRFMSELRANQKTGLIDPALMIKATQAMNTKEGPADQALYWNSMGPDNMAGQTTAVVYDNKTNPNTGGPTGVVYVGSKGGGVFKSYNYGITWHSVGFHSLMVSCMVQAADGTIYIGTGDNNSAHELNGLSDFGNPAYSNSFVGTGIHMMVNDEITQIASTKPSTNENGRWSFVNDLAVAGNYLLAATDEGIFSSADKGQTWVALIEGQGVANEVKVMADNTTVVASVGGKLYKGNALELSQCLSSDAATATLDEDGNIVALPLAGILDLACSPQSAQVMYATCISTSGTTEGNHTGVYLTKNGGATWELVYPGVSIVGDMGHQIYDDYGRYHHFMAVDPSSDDILYICGYNLWSIQKPSVGDGLYEAYCLSSGTSGITGSNFIHVGLNVMAFNPNNSKECYVGTDGGVYKLTMGNKSISSYNCNRNYISTRVLSVGICGNEDRVLMGILDHGLVRMEGDPDVNTMGYSEWINPSGFLDGAFDQAYQPGPCAISAIQPNSIYATVKGGGLYRSNTVGDDWVSPNFTSNLVYQFALSTDVFYTPITMLESYNDPQSKGTAWYFNKDEDAVDLPAGTTVQCMSDNGYPFDHVLTAPLAAGDSIEVHDPISNRMAIGTAKAVYFTRMALQYANETVWYRLTPKNFKETALSLAFTPDGNTLFMGTVKGKIYRFDNLDSAVDSTWSTSGSNAWTYYCLLIDPVEIDLGTTQSVTSIAVDPRDGNKVVVTLGNYGNEDYVLYSTNALAAEPQFDSKQGNLPQMPVYTALVEMNTGHVLLGTEHGIYRTKDINGANWVFDAEPMGDIPVMDLKQQRLQMEDKTIVKINENDTIVEFYPGVHNTGDIYAATYGRGVFRCENYKLSGTSVPEEPAMQAETIVSLYPNPVSGQATVSFSTAADGNVSFRVYDLMGRMVMNQQAGHFAKGENHQINVDMSSLSAGSYIMRLEQGSQASTVKFVVY